MDPNMNIFISSSRFLCNARISSMELLLRCYGPKKTDIGSCRWKATPPESCEKMKIYMVEPEIFLVWPPFQGNFYPSQRKKRSSAEKSAIIGIMNHGAALGAEKTTPRLGVSGWPTTTTTDGDACATVGSEPLTRSWQVLRRALTGKKMGAIRFGLFCFVFLFLFFFGGFVWLKLFVFFGGLFGLFFFFKSFWFVDFFVCFWRVFCCT